MKTILNVLTLCLVASMVFIGCQGSAHAQQTIPTIEVIDTYIRGIDSPDRPSVAGQGPDDRSAAKRKMKCNYLSVVKRQLSCPDKVAQYPEYLNQINVSGYYESVTAWAEPLLTYARSVYNGDPRNAVVYASRAYTESIAKCNQNIPCINQVTQYFGLTTVPIPSSTLPYDLGTVINELLRLTPAGNNFNSSAAGKLAETLQNGLICRLVADEQDKNLCDT